MLTAVALSAQAPDDSLGRPAPPEYIERLSITVLPDGRGLPEGRGTAREGARLYELRCRECHGPAGEGGDETGFIGDPGDLAGDAPRKNVGSFWPYATTLWDYIHRAMPFETPGSLSNDEVYAVTAYLLQLNGLIDEDSVLDRQTLPKIEMPNRDGFIADPRPDVE